jgi:hypothetical protein
MLSATYLDESRRGYSLKLNDEWRLRRFMNTLDYSLELIHLREVYLKTLRRKDFSFFANSKEYSKNVINVTFKYGVKAFNMVRGPRGHKRAVGSRAKHKDGLFVKYGCGQNDLALDDSVCVRNEEVIAIETGVPVAVPLSGDLLPKGFRVVDGKYQTSGNFKSIHNIADIRNHLYKHGFVCDGIRYVRYKRSAGSSRVGKCLFIDERLYRPMMKWSMCGIKIGEGEKVDLAALESYISLTLSSIINTVEIRPENILVVNDFKSTFRDTVMATKLDDGRLTTGQEEAEITNNIWDGQSLLDVSMFGKYAKYGMLLLRNRFFKSCCFNTNLQRFFRERGVTEVGQLNGFTLAEDIKDIKLVTTPSSIKFLKFGKLKDWLSRIEPDFGIVKHDKPTQYFDGRMVQCHYQLLNSIQLTYDEVGELAAPTLDYIAKINDDPAVLRYHIGYPKPNYSSAEPLTSKNAIVHKLLGLNGRFARTRMYYEFKRDLLESLRRRVRCGRLLVRGNYSTLFGNPVEMLLHSVGSFDGSPRVEKGRVHSRAFDDGEELLGSRSPHVTMGNVLLATNCHYVDIENYFNLSNEIVCVNSIGENTLERLSGADFDSDTMLLTNNRTLINAARRSCRDFDVPTKFVAASAKLRTSAAEDMSDLDIKTSVNKIGEIINLSQELNSILWDLLNKESSEQDVPLIYRMASQLDIMSNIEIDSAKREYCVNNAKELQNIRELFERFDEENRRIRPMFFKYIDKYKGYYDPTRKAYTKHMTSMDYLQSCVNRFRVGRTASEFLPFDKILCQPEAEETSGWRRKQVVDLIRQCRLRVKEIWESNDGMAHRDKYDAVSRVREETRGQIGRIKFEDSDLLDILADMESDKYRDIRFAIFTILFGVPNRSLYDYIARSAEPIPYLRESDNGKVKLFDFCFDCETR